MKLRTLLAACVYAMLLPLAAQTTGLEAIRKTAEQEYVERYNELIKSGKLDPAADSLPGKPDSIERRLWTAGYYSVVVELLDPKKARMARHPGDVQAWGRGVNIHYNRGALAAKKVACEIARELYLATHARQLNEENARLAAQAKGKKAGDRK